MESLHRRLTALMKNEGSWDTSSKCGRAVLKRHKSENDTGDFAESLKRLGNVSSSGLRAMVRKRIYWFLVE
jgi:hypothetical protein